MKTLLRTLPFLCAMVVLTATLIAGDAKHGLTTVDRAWAKAMIANDAAACAALYAEDAVLVLPGTGQIKGRKAIEAAYAGWMAQVKVLDARITHSEYRSAGDLSTGWGTWKVVSEPRAGGAAITETGSFTAVAAKKNGRWMYLSDHASADPAPSK